MAVDAVTGRAGPTPHDLSIEHRLAQLTAIVESSDDAVLSQDLDGRIVSWNRGAERLYGYAPEEILGEPGTILVPERERAMWLSHEEQARSGGRVERIEAETSHKDGMPVPVWLTMAPIVDGTGRVAGVATIARDRTEQRMAQETLADAAQRLREGEALAHVGGWVLDRASADVQWSEELHRIHGIEPADFGGNLAAHLAAVHPGERAAVAAALDAALGSGELFQQEYRIQRPDRSLRWVYATAYPVRNGSGDIIGLRGIGQDVTPRREAEDSIREAYARERSAAEDLRVADRVKDEFLATVSHELRTPLAVILGFASLATEKGPSPEYIAPIARHADEMHRMVERLLDFTRLQAGKVSNRPVRLALLAEIERCIAGLGPVLHDHEVAVDVDPSLCVEADEDGLARVLGNLLGNAAKFAPPGSAISVRAGHDGTKATISVTDEGRGVPTELQARVFDRFFQAPDQPPGKRGTGIGLAIAKRYTELMGGRIWCVTGGSGGATFVFSLPMGAPA